MKQHSSRASCTTDSLAAARIRCTAKYDSTRTDAVLGRDVGLQLRRVEREFYPEKFSSKNMLPYYAERLPTVEINYNFYRMPTERLLRGWSAITPETFRFTLKAPRRITHDARLKDCDELTRAFCDAAGSLR